MVEKGMAMYEKLNDILTIKDVYSFLCVGRNVGYELIKTKKIKSIRIKGQYRILKSDLIEYIENERKKDTTL